MSNPDYFIHRVPKTSAGKIVGIRIIEEPIPKLKALQRQIIKQLMQEVEFPSYINGVARTSIITNSTPHINKYVIYKIDLKNFFHTIDINKIRRQPINPSLMELIENHCMYENRLPTGAPTSPILANIAFLSTDIKIRELLTYTDISYTRYMDDICMSSNRLEDLSYKLINQIFNTITSDGYIINRKKSGISLNFKRQEVTGVIVNKKLNLSRNRKLLLRSKLDHQARISNKLSQELLGELAHVSNIRKDLFEQFNLYFQARVKYYDSSKLLLLNKQD
jgi:RNA-directed DNA polymerase